MAFVVLRLGLDGRHARVPRKRTLWVAKVLVDLPNKLVDLRIHKLIFVFVRRMPSELEARGARIV